MATGFTLPTPIFTGVDNNGAPVAAGRVEVYLTGTSTHATTYADQALTVPNPWPVILDAAGRANIFVPDGSAAMFDVTLKTSLGVVLWSALGISVPVIPASAAVVNVPAGGILAYGGAAAPTGYLLCNGAAVSRITFAALFTAIQTAYGAGDGSTTFNVPDLRQRFPLGVAASGTGSTLGATGGTIDHVHAGPSHTHTIASHTHTIAHTHSVPRDGWGNVANTPPISGRVQTGDATASGPGATMSQATQDTTSGASSATDSGGTALTTVAGGTANTSTANPPFQTVTYIIKT